MNREVKSEKLLKAKQSFPGEGGINSEKNRYKKQVVMPLAGELTKQKMQ